MAEFDSNKTMAGLVLMLGAVLAGCIAFSALRTLTYYWEGRTPNMGPEMFILLSPVLAAPIMGIAGMVHVVFFSFFGYEKYRAWFLAGISWSSVLLGLIEPWLLYPVAAVNPITVGLFFWLRRGETPSPGFWRGWRGAGYEILDTTATPIDACVEWVRGWFG